MDEFKFITIYLLRKILAAGNPIFPKKYDNETDMTPNPYFMLRPKLMDEASSKYLVGQVISAISYPAQNIWASI